MESFFSTPGRHVLTVAISNSLQVSTKPCVLLNATILNSSASARFMQVHNAAATPAEGAVQVFEIKIAPNDWAQILTPIKLSIGCYICSSLTAATKTLAGAEQWMAANVLDAGY